MAKIKDCKRFLTDLCQTRYTRLNTLEVGHPSCSPSLIDPARMQAPAACVMPGHDMYYMYILHHDHGMYTPIMLCRFKVVVTDRNTALMDIV